MKNLLICCFCFPAFLLAQPPTYNISINTPSSFQGNLFFQRGGTPQKPVKIINSFGNEIFAENWGMKGWDFKVNFNNKLSYFDRSTNGWFIMDSLQNIVDSVYCKNGYVADNHDFLALKNGNYVLISYDSQPYAMDTVVTGGDPNAIVEGFIIQELDSAHNLIFEWKSWDHFHITDNTYLAPWTGSQLNFIHGNAIDIDFDGHFLISSRNLDEITKIHRITGDIIWRWGGSQNEFSFINDYPFTHQHTIRSLGNNRYLLYDNGNYSDQHIGVNLSRAVEYELDTNSMVATKVWEFVHPDSLYTPSTGSTQRLPNGNTLINFGNLQWAGMGSVVTEVDSNSQIVYQVEFSNGSNLYRAHKFDWFFYSPNSGCTDSLACNYDSIATVDDGSCCYTSLSDTILLEDCDILSWGVSGLVSIYDSSGIYIDPWPSLNTCGCDSFILLDITIFSSYSDSLNPTVVVDTNYYTWPINGVSYTVSGLYSQTYIDVNGCDSTLWLDLTIVNITDIVEVSEDRELYKIIDVLGKENLYRKNTPLFYMYKDGRLEKKVIIE